MCREGGGKGSPGVITLMNPPPGPYSYRPLYLRGPLVARRGGSSEPPPAKGEFTSRPMVARLVRYGPVRQNKLFYWYICRNAVL